MAILILYSEEGGSTNVRTTNLTSRVVVLLVNGELERIWKAQVLV
jgi:hypothetical protein